MAENELDKVQQYCCAGQEYVKSPRAFLPGRKSQASWANSRGSGARNVALGSKAIWLWVGRLHGALAVFSIAAYTVRPKLLLIAKLFSSYLANPLH
jgi:hypothetical protein